MIVAGNSTAGLRWNATRRKQLQDAWTVTLENFTPGASPLFCEHRNNILGDLGGATTVPGDGAVQERLWNYMKGEGPLRQVERVTMNRYFNSNSARRAVGEIPRWHSTLMANEFLAWRRT